MNRSSVFIFILELCVFCGCVFAYLPIWHLSDQSIGFLLLIFLFSWVFRYQRTFILLEYYTHIISVVLLFLFVVAIVTVTLHRIPHILLVGASAIFSWLVIVSLLRFIFLRLFDRPYKFLIHPDLLHKITSNSKIKLIAELSVLPKVLKNTHAIVVDREYHYLDDWKQLILHAGLCDVPVLTVKEYEELIEQRLSLAQLNENWMYTGFTIPIWYRWLKNIIEFFFALILLPLLLIIYLLVSAVIFITMGRPIFYTQYRMGLNNKPFKVYKFRSMVKNADTSGETQKEDLRVTRFGSFMRKFRIDELPQFFNILKGEMSLIGPRPEWIETAKIFQKEIPLYRLRHIVKPGITGWAQVTQGHTTGAAGNCEKLQYDLYYVKHYSLILDIKVVIKTIYTILTGFGAK